MFRSASRTVLRSAPLRSIPYASSSRRLLSSAPPAQTSRSWKSAAARWGLAFGLIYYYNTSNVFAEEPAYIPPVPETEHETETLPTLESITAKRQERIPALQPQPAAPSQSIADQPATAGSLGEAGVAPGSPQELEEEADQQGAFNPETGEINWDCPCLGGMAHGPCGEEFKAAFSCFVYSKEEPKGMDCIEKFKGMQDCFRQHPDIYGAELDDDDDDVTADVDTASAENAHATQGRDVAASEPPSLANMDSPQHGRGEKVADHKPHHEPPPENEIRNKRERTKAATEQVARDHGPQSESDALVPKAAHDAR